MQTRELEGYLYPDTHLFPLDITADKVVTKMRSTFDQKFTEKMRTDLVSKGRSIDQVVILASLLERETLTSEERPVVSGILTTVAPALITASTILLKNLRSARPASSA